MLNNVALNIAISLVFIYLLYSLLATTIKEFIATIFSYRSRMLERGIEQMLDGQNFSYYWWDKVLNFILWCVYSLKGDTKKVIKTIEHEADVLKGEVKAVEVQVKQQLSRANFFQKGTSLSDVQNVFKLPRIKLDKKAALFAAKVTEHPLYLRSAENSWLYKKPAYLSAATFSDILLDIIKGTKEAPVIIDDVQQFVNTQLAGNPSLQKILNIYIEQSNGDMQRFKLLVENWYDTTMERVSGWYKKQANRILFIIGFVLALIFNVSTIRIVDILSKDKTVSQKVADNASAYVQTHIIDTTNHVVPVQPAAPDTAIQAQQQPSHNDSVFAQAKAQIDGIRTLYDSTIADNNNLLGLGWDTSIVQQRIDTAKLGWFNHWLYKIMPESVFVAYYNIPSVIYATFHDPYTFIGFLLTALAISLGAPFWFDLLNKFINLRATGAKPAESKDTSTGSKTATLNQAPNPAAKG
ncbi:hypothetical protein ACTHGU_07555 [Chitinophagaceae bacterium MMS25-I14]